MVVPFNLPRDDDSTDLLRERGETAGADDGRTPLELLVDPIGLGVVVLRGDRLEDLAAICRPEVALVSWSRRLPDRLAAWLDGIAPDALPDLRLLVAPNELVTALPPLLDHRGLRPCPHREALVADMRRLAALFAAVTSEPVVDVRLERVRDNACARFHRDCVRARLLTTYRGPGTQWVRPEHGEAALRASRFAGPIEQLPPHAVAIFKGSCADGGRGIVHRSPPIAGTGIDRLLLCLNEPSASSPERWTEGRLPATAP